MLARNLRKFLTMLLLIFLDFSPAGRFLFLGDRFLFGMLCEIAPEGCCHEGLQLAVLAQHCLHFVP